jgi:hypothetical protein
VKILRPLGLVVRENPISLRNPVEPPTSSENPFSCSDIAWALDQWWAKEDWSAWLAEKDDEKMLAALRIRTRTGRPAGNKKFVAALEARLGRRLQPRSIGRPKKMTDAGPK